MCVVALAFHQHPDWPIILIGNRDEFHARDSAPLHRWEDGSGIIGGRDLVGGGTWLGVHPRAGGLWSSPMRAAGGTPDPAKQSRGMLVQHQLTGAGACAGPNAAALSDFNGFSLLRLGSDGAALLTNRPEPQIRTLTGGVHALANEDADAPCAGPGNWLPSSRSR